jgi:hypothetical protein
MLRDVINQINGWRILSNHSHNTKKIALDIESEKIILIVDKNVVYLQNKIYIMSNITSTLEAIDLSKLTTKQIELVEMLNTSLKWDNNYPERSIMHYEQLCTHDDGFLCEHRLIAIINWLNDNGWEMLGNVKSN